MKKLIVALVILLNCVLSLNAMSYEQARRQALFLTDKMAYELNLTEDQYEAAYEINLDYFISIDHYADLYGIYWRRRNTDLSCVLFDWQYRTYCITDYFYRPYVMKWVAGDLEYMQDIRTEIIIISVTPHFIRPIAVLIVGK
ncbi:hypothetical protein [Hoylesella saccharolytica]|uniref:hypothetical protein n=1 Tax=Hoylesella saccharolytica TaxID=633701 RepID=UPI001F257EC0|nr:hypothetical protein [Hoylesella saccharolytica]